MNDQNTKLPSTETGIILSDTNSSRLRKRIYHFNHDCPASTINMHIEGSFVDDDSSQLVELVGPHFVPAGGFKYRKFTLTLQDENGVHQTRTLRTNPNGEQVFYAEVLFDDETVISPDQFNEAKLNQSVNFKSPNQTQFTPVSETTDVQERLEDVARELVAEETEEENQEETLDTLGEELLEAAIGL